MFDVPIRWAGRGRPLLFLHGAWGPLEAWQPGGLLARLAEEYLVLAPSHPGYDDASGLEHLDDVLDLAVYYLDLLDELLIDSPHLVGHGFGGMIAAEMASLAPQRVAKLVLAAPYGLWLEDTPLVGAAGPPPAGLTPAALPFEVAVPGAAPSASEAEPAAARLLRPSLEQGLRKRLHRLLAPTLLVWGEHDRIVPPAYADAFHRRIAHSRIALVADAGHAAPLEQPAAFSRLVLDFLEG
jgi:pimeloyl-ACP methyl ester carboxylesterase